MKQRLSAEIMDANQTQAMTSARKNIVIEGQAGTYHCVQRCVRRAWLCGEDHYNGRNYDHRKQWLEDRLKTVGQIFACGIYSFAIMSNHFHIVVHMSPKAAHDWSAEEVATRWVHLYSSNKELENERRKADIVANPEQVEELRGRLCNVSWLMKSISEPIARRANGEDEVNGRFWQGRFRCQALLSEKAILAAMTYADLNPVRAKIASNIESSNFTGARARAKAIRKDPNQANQALKPLIGTIRQRIAGLNQGDYLELVDFTGRQIAPGKRGRIREAEPKALRKLGMTKEAWTANVKGVGSGYWRVIGKVEELREFALNAKRTFFRGLGFAAQVEQM